jgi:hypothetical protein
MTHVYATGPPHLRVSPGMVKMCYSAAKVLILLENYQTACVDRKFILGGAAKKRSVPYLNHIFYKGVS